jgi:hypothetical protein
VLLVAHRCEIVPRLHSALDALLDPMIPRCAVFLSWAFLRCLWTNEPLRRSANALLGVVLQEIFAPFGSAHCLVLASLGLLAPFAGQAPAARLVCPLAMSMAPSAVSRLALFLGSNTFPPSYIPEYVLIPYQEVLLHRFPGMRSRGCPQRPGETTTGSSFSPHSVSS